MEAQEREQMEEILYMKTGWNKEIFERMTDKELQEEYERLVIDRDV